MKDRLVYTVACGDEYRGIFEDYTEGLMRDYASGVSADFLADTNDDPAVLHPFYRKLRMYNLGNPTPTNFSSSLGWMKKDE